MGAVLYCATLPFVSNLAIASHPSPNAIQQRAVAVVGPTAIGKTAVAVELAKRLGGRAEILSMDSVQVYKHLDIGAAKPSSQERGEVAFHLLDLIEPDQPFTLSDYQTAASDAAEQVFNRGSVAILSGGTGLYFRSLTQPLALPTVPPDESLRSDLMRQEQEGGPGTLHRRLLALDETAAARLHPNDAKRVIRALEVIHHTQEKISELHRRDAATGQPLIHCDRFFALNCERSALYQRIEQRVDAMMADGFLDEVRRLRELGYARALRSMSSLGYNELNAHLDGELDMQAAVAMIKQRTRQYARRQLIWFRADPRLTWMEAPPERPAADVAQEIASTLQTFAL